MLDTLNLRLEKIPLSETPYFSSAFLDYLVGNSKLKDLEANNGNGKATH